MEPTFVVGFVNGNIDAIRQKYLSWKNRNRNDRKFFYCFQIKPKVNEFGTEALFTEINSPKLS